MRLWFGCGVCECARVRDKRLTHGDGRRCDCSALYWRILLSIVLSQKNPEERKGAVKDEEDAHPALCVFLLIV